MKNVLLAVLSGALILSGSAHAAKAKPKPKPSAKVAPPVCPVMGTKINNKDKSAGKSVYKGVTYYFCCAGCKPEFDKNPAKYVKPAGAAKKAPVKAEAKPKTMVAQNLVCAVTGEKIASKEKAAGSSEYKGETYYFCCGGCKSKFDENPDKFITKATGHDHNH